MLDFAYYFYHTVLMTAENSTTQKQKNLSFFQKELPTLITDNVYHGKFIVINDEKIKGAYDSFESALSFAVSHFSPNDFIIQQVIDDKERINFIRSAIA